MTESSERRCLPGPSSPGVWSDNTFDISETADRNVFGFSPASRTSVNQDDVVKWRDAVLSEQGFKLALKAGFFEINNLSGNFLQKHQDAKNSREKTFWDET